MSYRCEKRASHVAALLRSMRASVSITNRCGLVASVTTDRSWNVSLPALPDEVNVVPTVAGPSGASRASILNPLVLRPFARPDEMVPQVHDHVVDGLRRRRGRHGGLRSEH